MKIRILSIWQLHQWLSLVILKISLDHDLVHKYAIWGSSSFNCLITTLGSLCSLNTGYNTNSDLDIYFTLFLSFSTLGLCITKLIYLQLICGHSALLLIFHKNFYWTESILLLKEKWLNYFICHLFSFVYLVIFIF